MAAEVISRAGSICCELELRCLDLLEYASRQKTGVQLNMILSNRLLNIVHAWPRPSNRLGGQLNNMFVIKEQ